MAKPVIKFKTYRQAAAVGGKIYGVPNLGDPVVADVTMQEVIDYAKLHNYSADTLSALLSQVISGVGDLVARDGRPRMLSDLLKFEPVIKGTFANLEQTVTNQKVIVRPRMLKEIKVNLDASDYAWQNQNDSTSPRLISVAPASDLYSDVTLESLRAALSLGVTDGGFGWSFAGSRLCPNGWEASCSFEVILEHRDTVVANYLHLEAIPALQDGEYYGNFIRLASDEATENTFSVSKVKSAQGTINAPAWIRMGSEIETYTDEQLQTALSSAVAVVFRFTRTTSTGDTFTVEKPYTL